MIILLQIYQNNLVSDEIRLKRQLKNQSIFKHYTEINAKETTQICA